MNWMKTRLRRRTVTRIYLRKAIVANMEKYIPLQHRGKQIDLEAHIDLVTESDARYFFSAAKSNLLNINKWYDLATLPAATFVLTDTRGQETEKAAAEEGDLVRINIPGPGVAAGGGYDWVDRKSTRLNSSHVKISYAVFCLKKK